MKELDRIGRALLNKMEKCILQVDSAILSDRFQLYKPVDSKKWVNYLIILIPELETISETNLEIKKLFYALDMTTAINAYSKLKLFSLKKCENILFIFISG